VGRDDQIRQLELEKRIARARRLDRQDVEPGPANDSAAQRFGQRALVDQPAARGVDEQRARLHARELARADQVSRLRGQRQVQRDHVRLVQHGVGRCELDALGLRRGMVGEQHAHAEAARDSRHSLADRALAEDADGAAVQVAHRVPRQAELLGALPQAVRDVLPVGNEAAPQRKDERKAVLRNGVHRVVADVADDDAARAAGGDVDVVGAGCGYRHQPQPPELPDDGCGKRRLVDDRDRRLAEQGGDFFRRDPVVLDPGVRERRPADVRLDRAALEEDDVLERFGHGYFILQSCA